ncbi:hypothetical protein SB725_17315 [Pseudomonas sp. SIMBA_041]|uniref:hypothetical protein n=1 Tax=Pseudomonas sp. SIMBA_041 TaxID=3085782 RepID=UPI00397D47F0
MKNLLAIASMAMLLSACGETTEQICQKTDQLLSQATGQGFADVGRIGCLKQTASEARISYEALNEQLKSKLAASPELMSRDEMTALVKSQAPFDVIHRLGKPDSVTFIPFDRNGKTIPVLADDGVTITNIVRIEYFAHSKLAADKDPKAWQDIQGSLATKKDGIYSIAYDRPLTHWLFGLKDENMYITFTVNNGQATPNIDFPKHFWQ